MKSISEVLYGMFLIFVAQFNPELKNTAHYQKVHQDYDYLELSTESLEQIGFVFDGNTVNYVVEGEGSKKVLQINNGQYLTLIDVYKNKDKSISKKSGKGYYPVAVLEGNYKILYSTGEAKHKKLLPILIPAKTNNGTRYFLYLFLYTKELKNALPADSNPEKYVKKLKEVINK